ncbi:hypothetical protein FGO68_gene16259 [Halteria grandinella]|uniref:Tetratricopeptide repeat protein n=1 Tax=Halteria grandinella TaxID=5974 RepID=A0A8J8NHN7_HALGN|nr:hypothetical protein FGO68_gene16259 [Halteria grandinella]
MKKQSSTQHDDKKLKIVYLEAQVALLTQNNKLDDAIAIYEQLIEIEPSFVNFYLNLSNSFNHFRQTSILNIQIEEINQCVRLSYTNRPNQLKYFSIFMYHINQQETLVVLRLQQVIQEQKYGKALNILIKRMKIDKELNQQIKASNYFELIGKSKSIFRYWIIQLIKVPQSKRII